MNDIHIYSDWESVYGSVQPSLALSVGTYTTRQELSNGDVYVTGCEFNKCETIGSYGGAVSCSSVDTTKMLLEKCMFISCTSSTCGGALYYGGGGNCVISKVCMYECSTSSSSECQCILVCVKIDSNDKNHVLDSSFSQSNNANSARVLEIDYGSVLLSSLNISFNFLNRQVLFCDSATCSFSYCSLASNTLSSGSMILLRSENSDKNIATCNILENSIRSDGKIIDSYGDLEVKDSCIVSNVCKYVFYAESCLITVSNCTLDDTSVSSKKSGSVTIKDQPSEAFINALVHISNKDCRAEFDSIGALKAKTKIRTKIQGNSKVLDFLRRFGKIFLLSLLPPMTACVKIK